MKAILICPGERLGVACLHDSVPLVLVPMLGKPLIDYWLEHLADRKVSEVVILAADRPDMVRAYVVEGQKYGVRVEVWPVVREMGIEEAISFVANAGPVDCVEVMDSMPSLPGCKLFEDYNSWFAALLQLMSQATESARVGMKEMAPGVWIGMHVSLAASVKLLSPCWIGNDVKIEADAVVGPLAIIEDRVCVERGAEIGNSIVFSETLVGEWTDIKDSIAWADTLTRLIDGATVKVADKFLLSALNDSANKWPAATIGGRILAGLILTGIAPFAFFSMAHSLIKGGPYWNARIAVIPGPKRFDRTGGVLRYFEVPSRYGWVRRWPQLWEAVCGRFAFIGNRPLTPRQVEDLGHEHEKLWLAVPMGVISLADVEKGIDLFGDRARAHACYYSMMGDWQLDFSIFYQVVIIRSINGIGSCMKVQAPVPEPYPELDGQG